MVWKTFYRICQIDFTECNMSSEIHKIISKWNVLKKEKFYILITTMRGNKGDAWITWKLNVLITLQKWHKNVNVCTKKEIKLWRMQAVRKSNWNDDNENRFIVARGFKTILQIAARDLYLTTTHLGAVFGDVLKYLCVGHWWGFCRKDFHY